MRNKVISYSLRGFDVFLKVPMIIIFRIVENNVLGANIYINIYQFRGLAGWDTWFTFHFSFTIHKSGKITRT